MQRLAVEAFFMWFCTMSTIKGALEEGVLLGVRVGLVAAVGVVEEVEECDTLEVGDRDVLEVLECDTLEVGV